MSGSRRPAIAFTFSFACVAAALVQSGCGEQTSPGQAVSGVVRVESQPLKRGLVTFVPIADTKGPRATAVVRAGTFELPAEAGPWPGSFRVEINATPPEVVALVAGHSVHDVPRSEQLAFRDIHADFSAQSKLTVEIQPGARNHFEFDARWGH